MVTQTRSQSLGQIRDEGLRQYMLNIYNHMTAGLAVSGFTAYAVYATGLISVLMTGFLGLTIILAPLIMILGWVFFVNTASVQATQVFYYLFVAVFGAGLSTLFAIYTSSSMIQVFFITAATFASASLYGYTTRRDLTNLGAFLFMGLIGIIIASAVNIFLASSALEFVVSILAVLIFTGLTAYDTQEAKSAYFQIADREESQKYGIMMALSLYLNFVNLFIHLLQLLGQKE